MTSVSIPATKNKVVVNESGGAASVSVPVTKNTVVVDESGDVTSVSIPVTENKVVVDESNEVASVSITTNTVAVVTVKIAGINGVDELYELDDVQVADEVEGDVLCWDDAQQRWENRAPANASAARSATIAEPVSGDSFTLFKTTRETTLTDVTALVSGGSVTYEIRYAADRTATGTLAIVTDTVTNTTNGDVATVQNQPVPTGSWVWLDITTVTGTVNEFNVSVAF